MKALTATDFNFPGQKSVYHGKVRDVYNINGEKLVMVATDRISAFDVVLPKGIPFKGQMLNQIAAKFLDATTDICPNWKMATPDPMVTVGSPNLSSPRLRKPKSANTMPISPKRRFLPKAWLLPKNMQFWRNTQWPSSNAVRKSQQNAA